MAVLSVNVARFDLRVQSCGNYNVIQARLALDAAA
jgi:hypothetical protein